ncbi:MAG TPA: ABC transporter permease [Caulobacteraceae bacterium]|jgi:NitT/TauT family transport system permease protein|nr:ABC transporter permease [Caulobacteraceae bacterium]
MTRLAYRLAPFALIVLLLIIWEAACRLLDVPVFLLPAPSQIAVAAWLNAPMLIGAALNTLSMAILAFVLASLIAFAVALLISTNPLAERAVQPLAVGLQVTPIMAVAPLAVIWAGLDHPGRAVVGLAAIVAFFPIFSGALTGLKSADPDLERLFDLYGAKPMDRLFRLRLPSAVPFLLEGLKVAAGLALIGAVVAEFVARSGLSRGLAWRLMEASNRLETDKTFAALLVLVLMGVGLNALMQVGERAALRWWRGR